MRDSSAPSSPSFASLVQQFFTEYLVAQRSVSARTVACYRDAISLFLDFASTRLRKTPCSLRLADITPEQILAFLDHLERVRHNAVRSRNLRLTALRAFLKFAGRRDVTALQTVERALAVPMKRFERPMLNFLTRSEMLAVLGQPGTNWTSQRDHLLLAMLYNTGARVSEMIGVRVDDVVLDGAACVHLRGKGRKQRSVPLWKTTVQEIRAWLRLNPQLRGQAPLLPTRAAHPMTRRNVTKRLALAVARATAQQPGLAGKRVSPHVTTHNRNGSPDVRRALQRDRVVARARKHKYHPPLRRGRPRHEREGASPAQAAGHQVAPIPCVRFADEVPAGLVTMYTNRRLRMPRGRGAGALRLGPAIPS